MSSLPVKKTKHRDLQSPVTEKEKADFKSSVGDLHCVTSQTRVDHAVDTSRLQKRQNNPVCTDFLDLGRIIRDVKETASFALRIRPIKEPVIACWSDSALYGAEGELLTDRDLEGYGKHKVYSQRGTLVAFMSKAHLENN